MVRNASMMAPDQLRSALQNWMQKNATQEIISLQQQVTRQASDLWTMEYFRCHDL
jgi:hypothetical protein